MMEDIKKLLKNVKKYDNSSEKSIKTDNSSEKDYFKQFILNERKNNKPIEPGELCIKLGTTKVIIEEILKEVDAEKKIKQEEDIKAKVPKVKKEILKKSKEKLDNFLDNDDKNTLKDIFLKITLFGIPLNFSLWCFIFHPFSWYSWFAYGYTLWFLKKEFSPFIRGIIHK